MAIRTVFFNLPKSPPLPLQPLSLFDQEFADFGNWIVQPCSATGSNNIAITPETNVPLQTAYGYLNCYSFVQQSTSTGPVFISYATLPQLPVYYSDGLTQIGSAGFVAGHQYIVQYNPALNGGTGGFMQYGPTPPPSSGGTSPFFAPGMVVGLKVSPGSPINTALNITVLSSFLSTSGGTANVNRTNGAYTLNTGTLGVGGLDTGSLAASTWYNLWLIDNGSFSTTVISLPANASPQVPAQWIYQLLVGAVFIDASLNIWPFNQRGGVGKTTTAVNFAGYLVRQSKRVLLIDADSQGSIGTYFNLDPEKKLYNLIVNKEPLESCVAVVSDGLHVICSDRDTHQAEAALLGQRGHR